MNKSKRVVNLILYVYGTGISNKIVRSKVKDFSFVNISPKGIVANPD